MDQMNQKLLLSKIGEARFVCVDLRLYLDTHPDDEAAKADYLSYSQKLVMMIDRYEQQYGPLMNFGQSPTDAGSWVFDKWPWDL